jgi:hypothetical protein
LENLKGGNSLRGLGVEENNEIYVKNGVQIGLNFLNIEFRERLLLTL